MKRQRPVRRDALDETGQGGGREVGMERVNARVDGRGNPVAQLDGQRGLAERMQAKSHSGMTLTCAASSAVRIALALAAAEGLSPCKQIVSAAMATRVPSCATTICSFTICTA